MSSNCLISCLVASGGPQLVFQRRGSCGLMMLLGFDELVWGMMCEAQRTQPLCTTIVVSFWQLASESPKLSFGRASQCWVAEAVSTPLKRSRSRSALNLQILQLPARPDKANKASACAILRRDSRWTSRHPQQLLNNASWSVRTCSHAALYVINTLPVKPLHPNA